MRVPQCGSHGKTAPTKVGARVSLGARGLSCPAPAGCEAHEANTNQQGSAGLWR
jgi:hypothetical protein